MSRLEWLTIGWMTANRLLLAAIAALALAGAAIAQETDSDVASTGEQGFRRFASLCRDQKAAVRRCVQVRSIGGGRRGHAMRSRRRPYRLLQENDEQPGVYGRGKEGNKRADGPQTMRMNAR